MGGFTFLETEAPMGFTDSPYLFNRTARTFLYAIILKYPELYTDEIGLLIDSIIDDFYSGGIGLVDSLLKQFIVWLEFRKAGWIWNNKKIDFPAFRQIIMGFICDAKNNSIEVPPKKVDKRKNK